VARPAGLRLKTVDKVIVLVADPAGHHRVDKRGTVTLPAAARQMCGIERGPALLLVGKPRERTLFVHSATILARLLADFYDEILRGSR
jgi:bifunctional DNA-binding transcriptional regulator/antitoxin component of YhaV-PrlF toxin-antitoxin module